MPKAKDSQMFHFFILRKQLHSLRSMIGIVVFSLHFVGMSYAEDSFSDRLQAGIDEGTLKGLHSIESVVDGETFQSAYFEGEDENWGRSIGNIAHTPDTLHDLRSVTKSIVGLMYAIARDDGIVPEPNAILVDQFPEYEDLLSAQKRRKITIEHTLTMTMGTAWDESLPYTDSKNSEIAMENADDRYRYILEQPITSAPGEKWNYSGGATALIAKIISNAANMPIDAYASKKLFDPLGIVEYTWNKGRDGEPSAASGLRLRAPDLAKIGQLIADNGAYKGKQIVSQKSLGDMLKPRQTIDQNFHYGHFWYLLGPKESPVLAAGFGNGGQRLSINASKNLVTVIFAGNYNDPNAWRMPIQVVEGYLVPELQKAGKL